jgi:hypothetical protein
MLSKIISIVIILFFSVLLLTNASCNCSKDCTAIYYKFELPVRIFPDTDTLQLGDSLTIIIDESNSFVELQSGTLVPFKNAANLGSAISFGKRDLTNGSFEYAANDFDFTLIKGKESKVENRSLYRAYLFAEENNRYRFHLVIKPKKPGLYQMVFSNSNNTYRESAPCDKANFTINLKETSHNRHLLGYTGEDLPGGDFYFVVK